MMAFSSLAIRPYLPKLVKYRSMSVRKPSSLIRSMEPRECHGPSPEVSERVLATDSPCIVKTKAMAAGVDGVTSLAQGVVHWLPPEEALRAATEAVVQSSTSGYGPAQGLPALREALVAKISSENGLDGYNVMVTAGANQAFVNVVLALTDASDTVVLFKPYYFNHLMAFQMTGAAERVVLGDSDPATLKPDLRWLQTLMQSATPPKMVVIVNPCNPSGTLMSKEEVLEAQAICAKGGAWLVMDNTYEHFVYDGASHFSANAPNVINLFSFSKAYGMMGWRVGYIAYPDYDGSDALGSEILKVQDTIPICAPQISQLLALEALRLGRGWVDERVASLAANRGAALDALSVLGPGSLKGGDAAIYLFVKLPDGVEDDERVVEWLIKKHRVTTIMGSSCGCPGHIRVAYANCTLQDCQVACARLKRGLQELVDGGMKVVDDFFAGC